MSVIQSPSNTSQVHLTHCGTLALAVASCQADWSVVTVAGCLPYLDAVYIFVPYELLTTMSRPITGSKDTHLVKQVVVILATCPAYLIAPLYQMCQSDCICVLLCRYSLLMMLGYTLHTECLHAPHPKASTLCSVSYSAHSPTLNKVVTYTHTSVEA